MRFTGQRVMDLYGTQLGQDVMETLLGAGVAAGGQILFTDMTPEQIAMSTGLGIGAAAIGRPIVGRAGQMVGSRLSNNAAANRQAQNFLDASERGAKMLGTEALYAAKMHPYAHLQAPAQVGQLLGRTYGDNLAQAAIALVAPQLVNIGETDNV